MSQVVLWDKIILRGENAMLDYRRYLQLIENCLCISTEFVHLLV